MAYLQAPMPIDRKELGSNYLREKQWPEGLITSFMKNLDHVAYRFMIVDDSGSMSVSDGQVVENHLLLKRIFELILDSVLLTILVVRSLLLTLQTNKQTILTLAFPTTISPMSLDSHAARKQGQICHNDPLERTGGRVTKQLFPFTSNIEATSLVSYYHKSTNLTLLSPYQSEFSFFDTQCQISRRLCGDCSGAHGIPASQRRAADRRGRVDRRRRHGQEELAQGS